MIHPILFAFLAITAGVMLAVSIALKDTAPKASGVFAGSSLFFVLVALASI